MAWETVPKVRVGKKRGDFVDAFITVRHKSIVFNGSFLSAPETVGRTHVRVLVDGQRFALGFGFHNNAACLASCALSSDGGVGGAGKAAKRGQARIIQPTALYKTGADAPTPWFAAMFHKGCKPVRYTTVYENGLFVAQLAPGFVHAVARQASVPADARGIYRLVDSSGATAYIGKAWASIRERFRDHQLFPRDAWDSMEYSVLGSEEECYRWESFHIERYKRAHNGKLPPLNRISGRSGFDHGD